VSFISWKKAVREERRAGHGGENFGSTAKKIWAIEGGGPRQGEEGKGNCSSFQGQKRWRKVGPGGGWVGKSEKRGPGGPTKKAG